MKTSKPFSTISYNTDKFLTQTLTALEKRRAISFWCWIEHFPEDENEKMHKHLYIVPNGQIDTDTVKKELEELDKTNPLGKPLGCIMMKPSKFDDWYLYSIHDVAYLASKGQARKYHYRECDMHPSCVDALHELVCTIDFSKYRKTQDFVEAVLRGVPFFEMVRKGQIPAPQFLQWRALYDCIYEGMCERNGREGHNDYEVNQETGEVLD